MELRGAARNAVLVEAASLGDYVALLKPRVMSLVVFTGIVGLVLAPATLHPLLAAMAVLCIAVGAGASGAINMWYERDIDGLMRRTLDRPLPAGRMAPGEALGFGVVLAVGSVALMGLALNWMAAALLAFTIGFYIFVYTVWLKRRTAQNIVIGGAAGALPPVIGWAAATGDVSLAPFTLFAVIFTWTPPHFWALALCREDDYAKAGVPMLPVVAGPRETRKQILAYAAILVPVSLGPWFAGLVGPLYGVAALALGALFIVSALRVWYLGTARSARALFRFSIVYLFLLFVSLLADGLASGVAWP